MWLLFGVIAIGLTVINLFMYAAGKDYKLSMAFALAFTSLTLCADYSYVAHWVALKDWGALLDVVPGMTKALWFLTITSIALNVTPVFLEKRKR